MKEREAEAEAEALRSWGRMEKSFDEVENIDVLELLLSEFYREYPEFCTEATESAHTAREWANNGKSKVIRRGYKCEAVDCF